MSIEAPLVAELLADSPVTALVDDRVYPEMIPQNGDTPAIVYYRLNTDREQMLEGPSDLVMARMRLDLWSTSVSGMFALADAVPSRSRPP